jgi:hypothetical protein
MYLFAERTPDEQMFRNANLPDDLREDPLCDSRVWSDVT